ncbi:MAG: hypothetical protein ACP5GI_03840 [Sulfolobales archaeon]
MSTESPKILAEIKRVMRTIDGKYELIAELKIREKKYAIYIPKLSKKPDSIVAVSRGKNIELKIISGNEGFCTCIIDSNKILSGCYSIKCLGHVGVWIYDEDILRSHRIEEIS